MAKVMVRGTGGNDQGVIVNFAFSQMNPFIWHFNICDFTHQNMDVGAIPQDAAQGRCDVGGR